MSPPVIYGFPPKSYKQKGLEPSVEPIPRFTNTHSIFASFSEISTRYHLNLRCWKPEQRTPTEPTAPPVHQKIHLDEVHTGLVSQLAKKNTCAI